MLDFFKIYLLFFTLCFILINAQEPTREKEIENIVIKKAKVEYKNKKENPAYAIMQEVWKRKRNNGLDKFNTYKFKEYEKIEFDLNNIDSTFMNRKVFKKLDFIFDYADSADNGRLALPLFLNEAIYKNLGKNQPTKIKKRIQVAEKTSGFQDNEIVSLTAKNLYRDFNIYDNTLNFFDIGFMSPVSKDGFSTYDYALQDTLFINGQESYKIRYDPKRKDILAFQGYLYISVDHYAVVQATLRSTKKMNVNFVNGIFTQVEYDNPNEDTFLLSKYITSLELSPFSKNKKVKTVIATRSVDYSDYEFDIPITEDQLKTTEEELNRESYAQTEEYWQKERTDSLNLKEQNIYKMLDELENTPRFTKLVKLYETLASGYYNIWNSIDLGSLYSIYGYNEVEGHRIRLGARTYFTKNDIWRLQGYTAYGFRDKKWKYGAEGKYMFNKLNRFIIGAGSRQDVLQLGVQLTNEDGIMSRTFASSAIIGRGINSSLSEVTQNNLFASIEPWKNFQFRVDASNQKIKSANPESFNLQYYLNNEIRDVVRDAHFTFSIIARPGAKFSTTGIDRYEHSTLAPTFILKYAKGLPFLDGEWKYDKLQLFFYQPFLVGSWGKLLLNVEAGKNFDIVPLALQNVIPGNQSYSIAANTFAQLNYYEFVADKYATMHIEHHFNGKILSYIPFFRKLKLRELAFFRGAIGSLSDDSKNINLEGYKYSAPSDKMYFEYGFGIENIGFGNLRIFRIDFNWRGNYLDRPEISKFGIKTGFQWTF